jgi:biopolymer transport protein ExbD
MSNSQISVEEEDNEINLTPMLDVVFIMLIFFIFTASFIKEAGIDVTRPQAFTTESQDANILIAISAQDEIWIDKKLTYLTSLSAHQRSLASHSCTLK